jgi:hypothetical protein
VTAVAAAAVSQDNTATATAAAGAATPTPSCHSLHQEQHGDDQQQHPGNSNHPCRSRGSSVVLNGFGSPRNSISCSTAATPALPVVPEPESPDTILDVTSGDDVEPLLIGRNHQHHRHSAIYSFSRFQEKVNAHLTHHQHHHQPSGHRFRNNRVDSYNGSICDAFLGRLAASSNNGGGGAASAEAPSNSFSLEEGLHLYHTSDDIIKAATAGMDPASVPTRYPETFQILSNNDSEINLELSASASEPDLVLAVAAAIAELAGADNNSSMTSRVVAARKKHVSINTDPPPPALAENNHRRQSADQQEQQPLRSSLKQHSMRSSPPPVLLGERRRSSGRHRTSCYEMVEFGVNPFEKITPTAVTAATASRHSRRKSSCLCWHPGQVIEII